MKYPLTHKGSCQLQTERLLLRRIESDDIDAIFANIYHDKEVLRYFGAPYAEFIKDVSIERLVELSHHPERYYWVIVSRDSGSCIGVMLEQEHKDASSCIEMGYAIGSDYWGNGYTPEAFKAVIRYLFDEVGFHKITAGCIVENTASKRVLEKCGLHFEGIRIHDMFHRGRFYDVAYYYILNPKHE